MRGSIHQPREEILSILAHGLLHVCIEMGEHGTYVES